MTLKRYPPVFGKNRGIFYGEKRGNVLISGYAGKVLCFWEDSYIIHPIYIQQNDPVLLGGHYEEKDFAFLQALPGRKILMKGNHDYWWTTKKKMDAYLVEKGLDTLHILSNNSFEYENVAICGTRGWIFEGGQPQDQKIVAREAGRLKMSLEDADKRFPGKEKLVFLHYPPVFGNETNESILQVLKDFGIRRCWYGHIHSAGCRFALNGEYDGVEYRLISADYLKFTPKIIRL